MLFRANVWKLRMYLGNFILEVQNIVVTFQHDSGSNKHNKCKIGEYSLLHNFLIRFAKVSQVTLVATARVMGGNAPWIRHCSPL